MAAALVTACVMFVFGVAYRVATAKLAAPVETPPISQEIMDRLPFQIGDWTGVDVPLSDAIVRQTDTDARVNRRYSRRRDLAPVSFYVAGGVRARDLMPHRPEVCFTGAGWTRTDRRTLELSLTDGTKLPCNVFEFSRGMLSTQKAIVLYYYIVDGQYCADVSEWRSKVWRGAGAIGYVSQVEIITTVTETMSSDLARKAVSEFAVESALPTAELFRHMQTSSNSSGAATGL